MRRRPILFFFALSIFGYLSSYALIRMAKPRWLLSREGTPVQIFCGLFYPLRFIDANKPDWFWPSVTSGFWITAQVNANNLGNGRLHFEWEGKPRRAFFARELVGIFEDDFVRLRLSYRIESWDDFSNHLGETITEIQKVPDPVGSRAK